MDGPQYTNERDEQLRMFYQIGTEDIKWAKNNQFRILYYVLLSFAAIIGFCTLIGGKSCAIPLYQKVMFPIIAFLINLLGIWHLLDTHACLALYRKRISAIDPSFTDIVRDILNIRWETPEEYHSLTKYYFFTISFAFILIIAVGACLIARLLFNDHFWWIALIMLWVESEFFLFFRWIVDRRLKKPDRKLLEVLNKYYCGGER